MSTKVLVLVALITLATSYTEQDNVLVLTDDDFPKVFDDFTHILVEFYAPWCGHCKKLAPVYKEVAAELKAQDSVVRLAKVDATVEKKSGQDYGVRGFPTLYFFLNGEKMDYTGQRSKESMVNWLLKKTRDPVVQIQKEQYEKLQAEEGVSVVYHGEFPSAENANVLNQVALADDYNKYYWGVDLGKQAGIVELLRSFDAPVTYDILDDGLKAWVSKNQRPTVVPFDERTIGDIFGQSKLGIVLFNGQDSNVILDVFTEAAKEYASTDGQPLIWTELKAGNEHLDNFSDYIKIKRDRSPLVMVNPGAQEKFVFKGELTKDSILDFVANYENYKMPLTEEVTYDQPVEEAQPTEEQL